MQNSSVSSGKKEENRRTLTDFKIVGLEIKELSWKWGTVPKTVTVKAVKKEESEEAHPDSDDPKDAEAVGQKSDRDTLNGPAGKPSGSEVTASSAAASEPDTTQSKAESGSAPILPPPPSRIRC